MSCQGTGPQAQQELYIPPLEDKHLLLELDQELKRTSCKGTEPQSKQELYIPPRRLNIFF